MSVEEKIRNIIQFVREQDSELVTAERVLGAVRREVLLNHPDIWEKLPTNDEIKEWINE